MKRFTWLVVIFIVFQTISLYIWPQLYRDSQISLIAPCEHLECNCASTPSFPSTTNFREVRTDPNVQLVKANEAPKDPKDISSLVKNPMQVSPLVDKFQDVKPKNVYGVPLFPELSTWIPGDWIEIDTSKFTLQNPMECDTQRAKEFKQKNPKYATKMGKTKTPTYHVQNLEAARQVLESLGIRFFISHGTLLGWYRECGMIEYTSDVDLGIPADILYTRSNEIIAKMKEKGFSLYHHFGNYDYGFELTFRKLNRNLDMFGFYYEPRATLKNGQKMDVIWNGFWYDMTKIMRKMYFPYSKFQWVNVNGIKVLAPVDMLGWLTTDYGDQWNVADNGGWNWWNSPKNFMDEVHFTTPVSMWEEETHYGPNLLRNPSFEELGSAPNSFLHWTSSYPRDSKVWIQPNSEIRAHGYRCVQFNNNNNATLELSQDVTLQTTGPTNLLISGWGRKDMNYSKFYDPEDFSVYFEYIGAKGGKKVKQGSVYFEPQIIGEWQFKSTPIRVTTAIKSARVVVVHKNYPGPGFVDNVSLRMQSAGCKVDCNFRGTCVYEQCHCFVPYFGDECQYTTDTTIK